MISLIFVFHTDTGELFWDSVNDMTFVRFFHGKWYVEHDTVEFRACKSELAADLDCERTQLKARSAEGINAIFANMVCSHIPAIPRDLLATTESYLSAIYPWPTRLPRPPNNFIALGEYFDLTKMRLHRHCGDVKYYCGIRIPGKYIIAKCKPGRTWLLHDGSNWVPAGMIRYGLLEERCTQITEI